MDKRKRIITSALSIVFVFIMIFSLFVPVFAADENIAENGIDTSDVVDDLLSMDKSFYYKLYLDSDGNELDPDEILSEGVKVVTMIEYSYSPVAAIAENFNLYFYIWTPTKMRFDFEKTISVNMATKYENGKAVSYENLSAEFVDAADKEPYTITSLAGTKTEKDLYGEFYKLRLTKESAVKVYKRVIETPQERVYDIAGIQLYNSGSGKFIDYGAGGTYKYKGYAEHCNGNSVSTLSREVTDLETLKLDVHESYYRIDGVSNLGKGHQWTLNSVYFAVPNEYIERYGSLQRIKAEWYELKTTPMIVASTVSRGDTNFYADMKKYLGKVPDEDCNFIFYKIGETHKVPRPNGNTVTIIDNYFLSYNKDFGEKPVINKIDRLMWLFPCSDKTPDPGKIVAGHNDILKHLRSMANSEGSSGSYYNFTASDGTRLLREMFVDSIDEGREASGFRAGYNVFEFDASDESQRYNYKSWSDVHKNNWFTRWIYGLSGVTVDEGFDNIPPIMLADMQSDTVEASEYYIGEQDADEFESFFRTAKNEDKTVVVLHFAVTDYYADYVVYDDGVEGVWTYDDAVFFAQETMFFNFDVISLTFAKESKFTIIPVIANPIDIIPDITAPIIPPAVSFSSFTDFLKKLFSLILLILLIILLLPVLLPLIQLVLKALVNVVLFPFRLLSDISGSRRRRRKNKRNKDD